MSTMLKYSVFSICAINNDQNIKYFRIEFVVFIVMLCIFLVSLVAFACVWDVYIMLCVRLHFLIDSVQTNSFICIS